MAPWANGESLKGESFQNCLRMLNPGSGGSDTEIMAEFFEMFVIGFDLSLSVDFFEVLYDMF